MSLFDYVDEELSRVKEEDSFRFFRTRGEFVDGRYGHVRIQGKEVVLFAGNDYLALSQHPLVKQAAIDTIQEFGVGSGASQLVSGHTSKHQELEERVARFMNKAAALIFPSGFQANISVISSLVGKDDLVIMDKLNHASLIDGCRLSGAEFRTFPHKKYDRLEEILHQYPSKEKKLIVTDAVFSMDGDLADLKRLVEIKKKFNAILLVDEAHATGVFGMKGSGLCEEQKVEEDVDVRVGTFSKAVGSQGGFVAADKNIIEFMINFSRPLIFSTGLAPHLCAAAVVAIDIIESDKDLRRKLLWDSFNLKDELVKQLSFDVGGTESPIIPLIVGEKKDALELSQKLMDAGFFIPAIRPPAVPVGKSRLRLTVSAGHLDEDKEKLLKVLESIKKG